MFHDPFYMPFLIIRSLSLSPKLLSLHPTIEYSFVWPVLSPTKAENSSREKLCLAHFVALNNNKKDVNMFKLDLMGSSL